MELAALQLIIGQAGVLATEHQRHLATQLDLLPAWREAAFYSERETAVLAIAEAATRLPLSEDSRADLAAARGLLGDEVFAAAEWVAAAINLFNRISILSEHPVRLRGADGKILR